MNKNKNINQLGLNCAILILDFNEWTHRNDYIRIMEDFFNSRINFEKFFFIINNFKLNEFDDFSSLTSKLFEDIDIVETDLLFRQDYQITEEQLKERIKVILLEMKNKYCIKFET